MARITRTQHVQYDEVTLLGVQGMGTVKFGKDGAPAPRNRNISAVFTGNLRITRLASGRGYNFLVTGVQRGSDRRRVHFSGDAKVRLGDEVTTVADYYRLLERVEALGI